MDTIHRVQILCGDGDDEKIVTLTLTTEQLNRINTDNDYLTELVNRQCALETTAGERDDTEITPIARDEIENINNNESSEANSLFIWSTPCVLLLLNTYEEYKENFSDGSKRHKKVWEEIAAKMKAVNPKYDMTGLQCQTKLNGLKRTYKKIMDHNNTSGNDRAHWPFFEQMNEIFGRTGWAQPIATASSDPTTTQNTNNNNSQSDKNLKPKRKNNVEIYLKQLREERQQRLKEKERRIKEKEDQRSERFRKLLEMRERQHIEKLKLIERLLSNKK